MKLTFNELRGPGIETELLGTDEQKLQQATAAFDKLADYNWAAQTAAMLEDGLTQETIDVAREFFDDLNADKRQGVLAEIERMIHSDEPLH